MWAHKGLKNLNLTPSETEICFDRAMTDPNDYGEYFARMRKTRGLSQSSLSESAGVGLSTIKRYESLAGTFSVRDANLDAILVALAARVPLAEGEMKWLADATGRLFDSFFVINEQAESKRMASSANPASPVMTKHTLEEQVQHVVHRIISAGGGELLLTQLKAMASHLENEISDSEQAPSRQRFQVVHPVREVNGKRVQDVSHYEVHDEPDASHPDAQQDLEGNGPGNNTGS